VTAVPGLELGELGGQVAPKKSTISVCSAVRVVLVADPTTATSRTPQKGTACYRRVRDLVVNQTILTTI
jgi:hypothetical protein